MRSETWRLMEGNYAHPVMGLVSWPSGQTGLCKSSWAQSRILHKGGKEKTDSKVAFDLPGHARAQWRPTVALTAMLLLQTPSYALNKEEVVPIWDLFCTFRLKEEASLLCFSPSLPRPQFSWGQRQIDKETETRILTAHSFPASAPSSQVHSAVHVSALL